VDEGYAGAIAPIKDDIVNMIKYFEEEYDGEADLKGYIASLK